MGLDGVKYDDKIGFIDKQRREHFGGGYLERECAGGWLIYNAKRRAGGATYI